LFLALSCVGTCPFCGLIFIVLFALIWIAENIMGFIDELHQHFIVWVDVGM